MKVATTIGRPVWFEPFLQQLKIRLGYSVDLSKLAQLLKWANVNSWSAGPLPSDPVYAVRYGDGTEQNEPIPFPFDRLYAVCRLLFLQRDEHERQFKEIFRDYLISELDSEQLAIAKETETPVVDPGSIDPVPPSPLPPVPSPVTPAPTPASMSEPPDVSPIEQPKQGRKYLNLTIPPAEENEEASKINSSGGSRFLLTDAYLPLSTREMIYGWRHLRKKSGWRIGNRLDVCATVQQIAKEGVLLQPQFEREPINSDDLLLILADRRGSMTPFHNLTDKLIETAVKEGGHRNAMVYYFYNCPADHVYKNPGLTGPVLLTELYARMRPEKTNALIISDAGATRGNMNELRAAKTVEFLYGASTNGTETPGLHKSALFVSWLNPMPRHRWKNTTAAVIDRLPNTPMYPAMENGYGNFLNIIDKLMGR